MNLKNTKKALTILAAAASAFLFAGDLPTEQKETPKKDMPNLSSEFQKFLAGDKKTVWKKINWSNKPEGIIEIRDGKLFIQSKGALFTGIYLQLPNTSIFSVTPGEKIRMTVTVQGTGLFGYWAYGADKKFLSKCGTRNYVSTKELKKHTAVFTVAEGVAKITPYVTTTKKGSLTVESILIEAVR